MTLSAFLALGGLTGPSPAPLVGMGTIFAVLSLITTGSGVKPRHELEAAPASDGARRRLAAVFAIHFCGVLWACERAA